MTVMWRPQMSVGNPLIDAEHKYLICLINTVELALGQHHHEQVVRQAIEQLVEYTREHFAHEEKLQLKVQFPGYAEHKREHQQLMERVEATRARILGLPAAGESPIAPPASRGDASPTQLADPEPSVQPADQTGDGAQARPAPPSAEGAPPADATESELVTLLREWVIDHVLKSDLKLRPYLEGLALSVA